jgi:hypothetical protein
LRYTSSQGVLQISYTILARYAPGKKGRCAFHILICHEKGIVIDRNLRDIIHDFAIALTQIHHEMPVLLSIIQICKSPSNTLALALIA